MSFLGIVDLAFTLFFITYHSVWLVLQWLSRMTLKSTLNGKTSSIQIVRLVYNGWRTRMTVKSCK